MMSYGWEGLTVDMASHWPRLTDFSGLSSYDIEVDGQHQDVDRVQESVRMTEDRDKWRKYVHGVANPRIEDG